MAPGPEPPKAGPARSGSPGHPWAAPGASLGRAPGQRGSLTLAARPRRIPGTPPQTAIQGMAVCELPTLRGAIGAYAPAPSTPDVREKQSVICFSLTSLGGLRPPQAPRLALCCTRLWRRSKEKPEELPPHGRRLLTVLPRRPAGTGRTCGQRTSDAAHWNE